MNESDMHTEIGDKLIGRNLLNGEFKIIRLFGEGGFARVYKGKQFHPQRDVAIKILKEEFVSNKDLVKHFHHEANFLAKLHHKNIISIHLSGSEEKLEYYVMDLHPSNLKEELEYSEKLSLDRWLNISTDITTALVYAYSKFENFIHRDIKPGNILLDEKGNAILTDFGLAKGDPQILTTMLAVTPGYMSIEQCLGQKLDHRSDIYSFGLVMYEMITGILPPDHLSKDPAPPSELDAAIPPGIDKIILKTLQKDKEERYQSANVLLTDLKNFILKVKSKTVEVDTSEVTSLPQEKKKAIKSDNKKWYVIFGSIFLLCFLLFIANLMFTGNDDNDPSTVMEDSTAVQPPGTITDNIKYGSLDVVSNPEGAKIILDDKEMGSTPKTIDSLSSGTKKLRLSKAGYVLWESDVEIKNGETFSATHDLREILKPIVKPITKPKLFGKLKLEIVPDGEVSINGKTVDLSQNNLIEKEIGPNPFKISFFHPGSKTYKDTTLSLTPGDINTLKCYFEGELSIGALDSVTGGRIFPSVILDGLPEESAPLLVPDIPVGKHTISVSKYGYITEQKVFYIEPSINKKKRKTIVFKLKKVDN